MTTLELTRRYSVVRFDNVRVPAEAVVGAIGEAGAQVERQTQLAIILHNSESVGAMQRAFEMTKDWAFDRYSFGRPLASYQVLAGDVVSVREKARKQLRITSALAMAQQVGLPEWVEVDDHTDLARARDIACRC